MMKGFGIIIVLCSLIFAFCESTPCIGQRQPYVGFVFQKVFITAGYLIRSDLLVIPATPFFHKAVSNETVWVVAGTCTSKEPFDKSTNKLKVAYVFYHRMYTEKSSAFNIGFVKTYGGFSESKFVSGYTVSDFDKEGKAAHVINLFKSGRILYIVGYCSDTGLQTVVEGHFESVDSNMIVKAVPFVDDTKDGCKLQPGSLLISPAQRAIVGLIIGSYKEKEGLYRAEEPHLYLDVISHLYDFV